MKRRIIFLMALMSMFVLPQGANAQWIHSPMWKFGGDPVIGGVLGCYQALDFSNGIALPGSDDEIPDVSTKRMWANWSWWYPFFNYEIPIFLGPTLESDNGEAEKKFFGRFLYAFGYQFGYFPKESFPVGMRFHFSIQGETFCAKMPFEEEFHYNLRNIIVPGGDIFIRIGNYALNDFNAVLVGGIQYKKVIGFKKKQWEKVKLFSFEESEYKYEKQDKKALNSGLLGSFGAGIVNTNTGRMITITYQREFFDYYNTDFVDSNGDKPYKGITSKNGFISINVTFVP